MAAKLHLGLLFKYQEKVEKIDDFSIQQHGQENGLEISETVGLKRNMIRMHIT